MEKFGKNFYKVITIITSLVLGWILLTYLSQGLEIAPVLLLFLIFIILVIVACLLYRQRYQTLLSWAKKRWPKVSFAKVLQVSLIVALAVGIIARLSFLFLGNRYGEDSLTDNGIHWYYAPALVNGEEIQPTEGIYEAFFPHLMTYSATLAGFMKIFGTGYNAVLFSNLIFDLIAVMAIYLLLRQWRGQTAARLGAIFWLLNPLEILFCSCSLSIVVTNMWLAIALLLSFLAIQDLRQQSHWWKTVLIALGLGLSVGIGNAYRPIFTVVLIAFALVLLYKVLCRGKSLILPAVVSFLLVVCANIGCSKLIDLGHQAINPYATSGVGVGWNFFIGANYDTNGHWSREDSALLTPLLYGQPAEETDVTAIQRHFLELAIDRYKAMGITKFLPHLLNKSVTLFADDSETITWPVTTGFHISGDHPAYLAAHSLGVIIFVVCVVLTFLYCLQIFWRRSGPSKWQFDTYTLFLMLCICGLIAISLLVEVMRRYTMPLLVIFVIFAATELARKSNTVRHA